MKTLSAWMLILFTTTVVHAQTTPAETIASMRYQISPSGGKAFGAQYFKAGKFAVINAIAEWADYDERVSKGFVLDSAKLAQVVSPKMPTGCEVRAVRGTLNWTEAGGSPIAITLFGKSCEALIPRLKYEPFVLSLTSVAHQVGDGVEDRLQVRFVDLPVKFQ